MSAEVSRGRRASAGEEQYSAVIDGAEVTLTCCGKDMVTMSFHGIMSYYRGS